MNYIGELIPVIIISFVLVFAFLKGRNVFSDFCIGAKKGLKTAVSILPTLIGIITGITMLSESGALDALVNISEPLFKTLGFPTELLALSILRPISGSGSNAAVINLFETHGADSEIGLMASVLSASTETTFYAVSVYFGQRAYKTLKYTVPVALFGDLIAIIFTVVTVRIFY